MKLEDYIISPCRGRLACEFVPKKKESLDLEQVIESLNPKGVQVQVKTPILVVFSIQNTSVTLFKSGKLIVKDVNEQAARKIAQTIVEQIQ